MADFIKRLKRDSNFTTVNNDFLRDKNLSWKAKGLIVYICHLPDDWSLNISDLKNRSKDGRDATAAGISELVDNGYCKKTTQRSKDGLFLGVTYEVSDIKFLPETENPVMDENPETENPETENPSILSTNKPNTKVTNIPGKPGTLFPEPEEKKELKTLFANSIFSEMDKFLQKFAGSDFEKIDLQYYYNSVLDWSDARNMKRTARGWIATARQFMRNDNEKGKLRIKPEYQQNNFNVSGAMDFLNDNF